MLILQYNIKYGWIFNPDFSSRTCFYDYFCRFLVFDHTGAEFSIAIADTKRYKKTTKTIYPKHMIVDKTEIALDFFLDKLA
jgi:hypothetical protein